PVIAWRTTVCCFPDDRFRDEKAMYMNVVYRGEVFSGLDMALFSDWGKVASADDDLDFKDLKHGYGVGFRLNTYKNVFFRFDIGGGGGGGVHYFVRSGES